MYSFIIGTANINTIIAAATIPEYGCGTDLITIAVIGSNVNIPAPRKKLFQPPKIKKINPINNDPIIPITMILAREGIVSVKYAIKSPPIIPLISMPNTPISTCLLKAFPILIPPYMLLSSFDQITN
jgi:hypothetical protein